MAYNSKTNSQTTLKVQDSVVGYSKPAVITSTANETSLTPDLDKLTSTTNYNDTLNIKDPEIQSKTLQTTFGREEDYVELHIKNSSDQLIYSEANFQDYVLDERKNAITINGEKILEDRGYISGLYKISIHPF